MQRLEVSGAVRHIYIYMSLGVKGLIKIYTLWKNVLILFTVLVHYFFSKAASFSFRYRHFNEAHCFGARIAQLV
jgi:hypothetical protein